MSNNFDREHRKVKWQFQKGLEVKLDGIATNDSRQFWEEIKRLGRKKTEIPWKIDNEDGSITLDREDIKQRWADAFESLYKNSDEYDEENKGEHTVRTSVDREFSSE